MIKAVVVDDERLVRKGFISLIDWAAFGVVIVGEAGDGNAALSLLREQAVDLLFVDLTMPGMSGFELIRHVRKCYPLIRCVVLTCHHEFDYVQEALRLGAVDYIVKTLLEVENADDTVGRLVERIKWEDSLRETFDRGEKQTLAADQVLLYMPLHDDCSDQELLQLSVVKQQMLLQLSGKWLSPLSKRHSRDELRRELLKLPNSRWQTALITGLQGIALAELDELVNGSVKQAFFYAAQSGDPLTCLSYDGLVAERQSYSNREQNQTLLQEAQNLKWALDQQEWQRLLSALVAQQPSPEAVAAFGYGLLGSWNGLLLHPSEEAELASEAAGCHTFNNWKCWLRRFSDHVQRRMLELGFSKEVQLCLIRAVMYMREHAGDKINQGDVAAHINMSRGYFSQCFARFAGAGFGEVLRELRLELAKTLLLQTDDPVCEVAYRSGFEDDRYFSRIFREHAGVLPSQYRAEGRVR